MVNDMHIHLPKNSGATKAYTETEALTISPTTRLAAILEAIRTAERTTPYRLCKSKETGDWMFNAPPIK